MLALPRGQRVQERRIDDDHPWRIDERPGAASDALLMANLLLSGAGAHEIDEILALRILTLTDGENGRCKIAVASRFECPAANRLTMKSFECVPACSSPSGRKTRSRTA